MLRLGARSAPWIGWLAAVVAGSVIDPYLGMSFFFGGLAVALVFGWRATKAWTARWPRAARIALSALIVAMTGALMLTSGVAALTFAGVIPEPPPSSPSVVDESSTPAVTSEASAAAVTPVLAPSETPTAGGTSDPTPARTPPASAPLTVTEPQDGAQVTSASLTIRGTAPPDAEVVRDAGFGFWGDEHFDADSEGNWQHSVQLDEGDNTLTFWLDADTSQKVTLEVRYEAARTATSPATASPTSRAASTPRIGRVASIEDAADDLQDRDEQRSPGPGYVDIREVVVSYEDDDLWLTLRMDADIPPARDLVDEDLTYGWFLDTNGDGDPDYHVTLINETGDGEWITALFDIEQVDAREGDDFPGTGAIIGDLATVRFDLDAIGNPDDVAIYTAVQRDDWASATPTTVEDLAPNIQWPENEAVWVRIQR